MLLSHVHAAPNQGGSIVVIVLTVKASTVLTRVTEVAKRNLEKRELNGVKRNEAEAVPTMRQDVSCC